MHFLYNFGIYALILGVKTASFFNVKAKKGIDGRKGLLDNEALKKCKNALWFHCASLGEFEQITPLIEKIKENTPDEKIIITFFSPSGFEIRKNYLLANLVLYIPFDTPANAKQFIAELQPKKAIFVRYEFWINHLKELHQQNIPTYFIGSQFKENQIYFKYYGNWFLSQLKKITHFYVQDDFSLQLLKKHEINNVTVIGDTRFDKVWNTCQRAEPLEIIEQFKGNELLLVVGSAWEPEQKIVTDYINNQTRLKFKIIIAPHEIEPIKIENLKNSINDSVIKYSDLKSKNITDFSVLIIDNIGMLSRIYKYADFALVGGGFSGKLHNILEPAAFGSPVLIGGRIQKFNEAQQLVSEGGAFVINIPNGYRFSTSNFCKCLQTVMAQKQVSRKPIRFEYNENEFNKTITGLLDAGKRKAASKQAKKYVKNRVGATQLVYSTTIFFENS